MTAIIITGPQGSGKTQNAEALAKHFKKTRIIDEWKPGDPAPANALCLTNVPVCSAPNVWRIEDAIQHMRRSVGAESKSELQIVYQEVALRDVVDYFAKDISIEGKTITGRDQFIDAQRGIVVFKIYAK